MEPITPFYFNRDKLREDYASKSESFKTVTPFPHVVFDDFLPDEVIQHLINEFPEPGDIDWSAWGSGSAKKDSSTAIKLGQSREEFFGAFTRHFMGQLNSQTFINFLEDLTGVSGIVVDPSYNDCGLHSTGPGGRLMIHTDANRHPHSGKHLHQILNLIIYLNNDWEESYGGNLELWTHDRKPDKTILPVANRAVLFSTGKKSFHGHPVPLSCPDNRRRNSLAVYYYSHNRIAGEDYDGMQRAVRWVATTADDHSIASMPTKRVKTSATSCSFFLTARVPCTWQQKMAALWYFLDTSKRFFNLIPVFQINNAANLQISPGIK